MQWIRVRNDLRKDARMTAVATALGNDSLFAHWLLEGGDVFGVVPFEAVVSIAMGGVMALWAEVSDHGEQVGEDAVLRFVQTPIQVEHIAGVPGIAAALQAVGWLDWDAESHAVFPGFMKHNTLKPKAAGSADRMRRWRERGKKSDGGCDAKSDGESPSHVPSHAASRASHVASQPPSQAMSQPISSESVSVLESASKGGVGGNTDLQPKPRDPDAKEADDFFGASQENALEAISRTQDAGPVANPVRFPKSSPKRPLLAGAAVRGPGGNGHVESVVEPDGPVSIALEAYIAAMNFRPMQAIHVRRQVETLADPSSVGEMHVIEALQWGAAGKQPWASVESRARSNARLAGWGPKPGGKRKMTADDIVRQLKTGDEP